MSLPLNNIGLIFLIEDVSRMHIIFNNHFTSTVLKKLFPTVTYFNTVLWYFIRGHMGEVTRPHINIEY